MEASARPYLRIATEEAFCPPEMIDIYRKLLDGGVDDPGFRSLWGFYSASDAPRARFIREGLTTLGERRLADMDAAGIDKQVVSLTSPGVQIMDRETAVSFAAYANDYLAEGVRARPDRYVGLTAIAPQDPQAAAKEIERGAKLGFKGVILNSHTHDEYFDDAKFWPILEAAEALHAPIYLHPNTPSKGLIAPLLEAGLDGAIYGFGVETGMHLLRIICSGAFDRFPNLKFVVGHLGEALPFWLFRLDYMHRASVGAGRYERMKPIKRKVSDYMRENVYVTTSGMPWPPAIQFCQSVLGMDRVLYAMDYPYQYDAAEVAAQDALPISDADKKKFFQANAEAVFGL
jgi:2,3-dihydroxybenzoate decarboxylase